MDQNKLKVLKEIDYKIVKSCKTCRCSNLSPDGWGTCSKWKYHHQKHGRVMQLSIHENGYCDHYEKDVDKFAKLNMAGFSQFMPPG